MFFDFWGTLVENGTYSPLKQSFSILRLTIPFGQFVEQFERVVMTKVYADQAAMFTDACKSFNVFPKPIIIDKLIGVWNKNRLLAKPYPETIEVLQKLKEQKIKLVLISNAPVNNVEPVLERFNMTDLFDCLFLSSEQGKLKNEGLVELALKKFKLKKTDAIMIGDSIETDIKAATDAGILGYLVDRRNTREFERKVITLTDVLKLVEE